MHSGPRSWPSHTFSIWRSFTIDSVGLVPRTNGPSTACGLHRDEQIRSHLGAFESGGVVFPTPALVTYLLKAPSW